MSWTVSVNHPCILTAINTTAKFGFLTRRVFDEQIAIGNKRTYKWMLWKTLLSLGLFEFHRDPLTQEEVIKFSARGQVRLRSRPDFAKIKLVSSPLIQNMTHDEALMTFALHNQREGLIGKYVTESYLKKYRLNDYAIYSNDKKNKFPDLIFSLNVPNLNLRAALEVERTRKSFHGYRSFVTSYAAIPNLDFVIVAYRYDGIKKAIKEAMLLSKYPVEQRPIIFCNLQEMLKSPSDCPLDINGVVTTLRKRTYGLRSVHSAAA